MKPKPLSSIEYTTLWMAIRYACNRQTIASAMLPGDIIEAYYFRLSADQRRSIVSDLKLNDATGFGNPDIDRPIWMKFMSCMDSENRYTVELVNGATVEVFEANGQIVPVDEYLKHPHIDTYLPKENIKNDKI